jgi:hypothetical protein
MSIYDEATLELVPDDTDLSELVQATAQNATAPVTPPLPDYSRWRAPAEELSDEDSWEADPDTPQPAGPPLARTVVTGDEPVQEAAVFKSDLHPRWPKGSGKRAGEFMRVGEQFESGGKHWQIAHIVNGRIYAHEASGKYAHVETKSFDVTKEPETAHAVVAGVKHHEPASVPVGGKTASTVTVVDPYVDPASHDPSIPVPAQSDLTAEQWKRFGKLDQEHYTELMERFGKHKSGAAQAHVNAAYKAYESAAATLVKAAYQHQYGGSSGFSLSLAAGHHHHAIADTPSQAKLRVEAMTLQAEHAAAVQWDLYNRAKAPDIVSTHKSQSWSAQQWHDYAITGDNPAFSGLSQSWSFRPGWWSNKGIITPLAIRHVLLSTASAHASPSASQFSHEIEVATPTQMKLDHRSLAFNEAQGTAHSLTKAQQGWLAGMTGVEPQGGHVLEQLRDAMQSGAYLAPPPKALSVKMDGASGKSWVDPPAEAAKPSFAAKAPTVAQTNIPPGELPDELPWKHVEDGDPKAVTGEDAGVFAGQYFMGLKGTLYWVGNDPGVGGAYPFRIHKLVDGAFNGENFAYDPNLPGYYLDASHEEVLPQAEGLAPFDPTKWVKSTDAKFLETFEVGEKFKLNGTPYEVTGKTTSGDVKVKDLDNGLTGVANGDAKSSYLVPFDGTGMTPEEAVAAPKFSEGDHVLAPDYKAIVNAVDEDGTVYVTPLHSTVQFTESASDLTKVTPLAPTVGMTFPMRRPEDPPGSPKVKATVTKLFQNGDVQVNLKPGKVVIPKDEWNAHAINAYDPGAHTIGAKTKLRDLKPGAKFHASAGNQTHRPYEVIFQTGPGAKGGQKTWVRNLDTAEVTEMGAHKSYPTLDPVKADTSPLGSDATTPELLTEGGVGAAWDPGKWVDNGQLASLANMPVGQVWLNAGTGGVFKKVADEDGDTTHVVLAPHSGLFEGQRFTVAHADAQHSQHHLMEPWEGPPSGADGVIQSDAATPFDPGKYIEGPKAKVGSMAPGAIFKTDSKGGAKYYQLSEDGKHTTNLLTGKVYDVKPHFHATPLHAGSEPQPTEDPTLTYPAGSTVYFDPDTKDTGMDEAVVIGWDPQAKMLAVKGSYTGETVYVSPHEISSVFHPSEDEPNAEKVAAHKSSGHTVTAEKLPNGKYRYRHNGEVHTKASGVAYTHATVWQMDAGDHVLMFHKTPAAAHKATSLGGNGYVTNKVATVAITPHGGEGGGVPVNTLKPGDKFTTSALGEDKVVQVVKNEGGEVYLKSAGIADNIVGFPLPKHMHTMIVHPKPDTPDVGEEKAGNQKTASPLGTNTQGKTYAELKPGAVFSPGHGGIKYVKLEDGSAEPYAGGGTGVAPTFEPDYVPDDLHSEPATQATVGKLVTVTPDPGLSPSLQWHGSKTGFVKKVRATDGAVQLHGFFMWHKPEHTTVHAEQLPTINGGDVVHSEAGNTGTFVKWDTQPNGDPAAVVDTTGNMDLETWDPYSITGIDVGTGMEQAGTPLISKAHVPTPYEQLAKGDTTALKSLNYGDVFKVPGVDEVYSVNAKPAPNAGYEDQYHTLSPLLEDGTWGSPFKSVLSPDEPVTFHSTAANWVPVQAPPVKADASEHPDAVAAGGFVGFTEPTAGPYVHAQVGSMPQGTVFEDAAGNVWKVKQAGTTPVISGGAKHYTVDGAERGKDLSQPNTQPPLHADSAGPLGGGAEADQAVAAAEHELVTNTNLSTLGSMHLKPGDHVKFDSGDVHTFEHKTNEGNPVESWVFTNTANGKMVYKGWGKVPSHASPSAFIEAAPASVPEQSAPPAPSLYTHVAYPSELKPGQLFARVPGSTAVLKASNPNDNGVDWEDIATHETGHISAGIAVFVQPEEEPASLHANVPPAPEGDPATVTTVDGPNGFAPEAPLPALDPNFSHESPLDPFLHRQGGMFYFPKLEETQPGQMFTDKSGTDYRVISHGSGTTVFENVGSGAQYAAPGNHRVKLTALPPDPGPQLKPVVLDLTTKHGSLENVPKLVLNGHAGTYGSDGKTKNVRLGHLKYGDVGYDADGHGVTFLGSWLNNALVLDHATNEARLADARLRVSKQLH